MKRGMALLLGTIVAGAACDSAPVEPRADAITAQFAKTAKGGRAATLGVVYVSSQGLYYDTFVAVEALPRHGPFQLLENGVTEFGPGDPGYLGGRWWVDVNGDGVQDADDQYFLCPLLGPGRPNP